eukprot:9452335-Pyramimonas_sp.AAC.1
MRFTELLRSTQYHHRPRDVLAYFDSCEMDIVTDHYTDCRDVWQLRCGTKGMPSDKNSRLSILSIREERLTGRIRHFMHCPTHNMKSDALTRTGIFPQIMRLFSTGTRHNNSIHGKQFVARKVDYKKSEYTERDLLRLEA